MSDKHSLLAGVINPGVPWWLAVPCNLLAGAALLLLVLDPTANLSVALALFGPGCGSSVRDDRLSSLTSLLHVGIGLLVSAFP